MEIHTKAERRRAEKRADNETAFAKDYTRKCFNCEATPVVFATGLCGPCTWGESETADGNW